MSRFKILYIEHGPEQQMYEQAMRASSDCVYVRPIPSTEGLDAILSEEYFDLIVTDAVFLPEGQDHKGNEEDGEYCLKDVIAAVERRESQRIRIGVLTRISEYLLTRHSGDLKNVDYLWDKKSTNMNCLSWWVKRIISDTYRSFPEHALIDRLLELVSSEVSSEVPWRDNVVSMLKEYRDFNLEKDQIIRVRTMLLQIAGDLESGTQFGDFLSAMIGAEPLNVAANTSTWGHLRHVVNVFWLGYFILNVGLLDAERIAKDLSISNASASREKRVLDANVAWLLAALFHDVGQLGERLDKLVDNCNRVLLFYPTVPKLSISKEVIPKVLDRDCDRILLKGVGGELNVWLSQLLDKISVIDHGLLSAATIIKHFKDTPLKLHAEAAAVAAAMHNVININLAEQTKLPNIDFDSHPLISLLIICDQIQVWDRETGQESIFGKLPIEYSGITRLEFNETRKEIVGTVTYYPFRCITYSEVKMKEIEDELTDILNTKVVPRLCNITLTGTDMKLKFKFVLSGKGEIAKWSLKR